jgi:hypothetical protein
MKSISLGGLLMYEEGRTIVKERGDSIRITKPNGEVDKYHSFTLAEKAYPKSMVEYLKSIYGDLVWKTRNHDGTWNRTFHDADQSNPVYGY